MPIYTDPMRMTGQRRAILEVLQGDTSHPTADMVYERVRARLPHISLGTVYRNLKLLAEEGQILEIEMPDGPNRYDFRTEQHYHFRCERCDAVFDVNLPYQHALNDQLKTDGFKVRGHAIYFYGRCARCRRTPIEA